MMGESFPFFDIVFLAMVAAFILLRLRAVLGRRTGHEKSSKVAETFETASHSGEEEESPPAPSAREEGHWYDTAVEALEISQKSKPGLEKIAAGDPSFKVKEFCVGSALAFETIIMAFAEGKRDVLTPLLASSVAESFLDVIEKREKAGQKMETTLISLEKIKIIQARLNKKNQAEITVQFHSQQVNILKDKKGNIVDGDRGYVEDLSDLWVFSRDLGSADPNWLLVGVLDSSS